MLGMAAMMPRNEVESRRRYPKASVNTMAMGIRGGRPPLPKKLLAASNMIARSQAADTMVVPTSHGHRRWFGPAQVLMPKQSPNQCKRTGRRDGLSEANEGGPVRATFSAAG